jgi:hypothetical protein
MRGAGAGEPVVQRLARRAIGNARRPKCHEQVDGN